MHPQKRPPPRRHRVLCQKLFEMNSSPHNHDKGHDHSHDHAHGEEHHHVHEDEHELTHEHPAGPVEYIRLGVLAIVILASFTG